MTQKHTPTPVNCTELVSYDNGGEFGEFIISTPRNEVYDGGREVAVVHQMGNAHDELVAALGIAQSLLREEGYSGGNNILMAQIEKALAKARGEA